MVEKSNQDKSKMTLSLYGKELKQALALKQIREIEMKRGLSVASIVREAIAQMYSKHIETVE